MNFHHITDVWSPHWNGSDSTMRILKQYQKLWVSAKIISAGHSPLNVAFTACTDLDSSATEKAEKTLEILWLENLEKNIVALNCAPRNNKNTLKEAKEDNIFRITTKTDEANDIFLLYWFDVLRWVIEFYWKENLKIERVKSVKNIIPDTSKWSQFRSWEFLPIVHFLESKWALDENAEIEEMNFNSLEDIFQNKNEEIVVLPSDEYNNCRILASENLCEKVFKNSEIEIKNLFWWKIKVKKSLTEVVPWEISIWLSSNHFFNKKVKVLNIWTRWKSWTTETTDENILKLSKVMLLNVGKNFSISL